MHPDPRGSRAGLRAPSGLHSRSRSVPAMPDLVGKRNTISNKFATWGVGSKGVTEDWNDDFDFEELDSSDLVSDGVVVGQRLIGHGDAMIVPETIKVQQTNVLANIGLLKEWGLLIEELKELRVRASVTVIDDEDSVATLEEVDAVIDLADQEVDEKPGKSLNKSAPSSPVFDFDDSPSGSPFKRWPGSDGPETPIHDRTPKQALTPQHPSPATDLLVIRRRAKKDYEEVAQSVIDALQNRRRPSFLTDPDQTPAKRIPFDTMTLRKFVPHVKSLLSKVKQILREAEGLDHSPTTSRFSLDLNLRRAFRSLDGDTDDDDDSEHGDYNHLSTHMETLGLSRSGDACSFRTFTP